MNEETFNVGFTVKMRHGELLRAMRRRGMNQAQAAAFLGISAPRFGDFLNLKHRPRRLSPKLQQKLMEFTGLSIHELFPGFIDEPWFSETPKNLDLYRDLTPTQLMEARQGLLPSTEDVAAGVERRQLVAALLSCLSPRLQQVARLRAAGQSYDEIGAELNVCGERVRTLWDKALEKMRAEAKRRQAEGPPPPRRPVIVVAAPELPDSVVRIPDDWALNPRVREALGSCAPEIVPYQPVGTEEGDEDEDDTEKLLKRNRALLARAEP